KVPPGFSARRTQRHQIARTLDECEDPSRPGAVGGNRGEGAIIEIELARFDLRKFSLFDQIEKPAGAIDRQHLACRADDLRHVGRGIPRTAAEIDERLADGETGAPPGVQRPWSPHTMLQAETG